ncbi:unnamed protein product [Prorocentrum cordatum]|uniref:Uncharacterized protein n=1 Tax=Prorocentrum cordatum TaxID=2364126 RepID=A0ABN9PL36_9DINO|nr:unnamed protein product [Polarella glacialis]
MQGMLTTVHGGTVTTLDSQREKIQTKLSTREESSIALTTKSAAQQSSMATQQTQIDSLITTVSYFQTHSGTNTSGNSHHGGGDAGYSMEVESGRAHRGGGSVHHGRGAKD